MKWQHWLVWGLLASWAIALSVYVFWDSPAEAADYSCSAVMKLVQGDMLILVGCPEVNIEIGNATAIVTMVSPELEATQQWSGRLYRKY